MLCELMNKSHGHVASTYYLLQCVKDMVLLQVNITVIQKFIFWLVILVPAIRQKSHDVIMGLVPWFVRAGDRNKS